LNLVFEVVSSIMTIPLRRLLIVIYCESLPTKRACPILEKHESVRPRSRLLLLLMRERRRRRITQCSCLENNFPFAIWHLCINFANTSFPRKILASYLMPPVGVNIDYSKGCVTFFTDFNFYRFTIVVNQVIAIKDILPVLAPTFTVEMP